MSMRLSEIHAHIDNVRQLGAVVGAIRGVAASRAQQSRDKIAGIEAHATIVAHAIGEALAMNDVGVLGPARDGRRKLQIAFCGESGFSAGLSDRVLDDAARDPCAIFAIGTRGAAIAGERGMAIAWRAPMANQLGAVPAVAARIAEALYDAVAAGDYDAADMVYPHTSDAGAVHVERVSLVPLDLRRFAAGNGKLPPLHNLPAPLLLDRLIEEYVSAMLYSAVLHSLVAENEARMAAMSAAREHIDAKLTELTYSEHQARQEQITEEVIELAASMT